MPGSHNLQRFLDAQSPILAGVVEELAAGLKRTHWMWFVFPQLAGLGRSPTAAYFGLQSPEEARAYLDEPVLGPRLRQCTELVLSWSGRRTSEQIFGQVDSLKLRSSLTLFDLVDDAGLFRRALASFFDDKPDERTLALLNARA